MAPNSGKGFDVSIGSSMRSCRHELQLSITRLEDWLRERAARAARDPASQADVAAIDLQRAGGVLMTTLRELLISVSNNQSVASCTVALLKSIKRSLDAALATNDEALVASLIVELEAATKTFTQTMDTRLAQLKQDGSPKH